MFEAIAKTGNRLDDDRSFIEACRLYLEKEEGSSFLRMANLSNLAALIYDYLDDINWAGFYLFDGSQLVLGPFQGEPACTLISLKRGVCGYSARERKTVIVEDVEKFPGHIACSSKSRSELVVPIIVKGELYGVIDIDSPILNRFTEEDASLIESVAELVVSLAND